ncbi:hypothetical protein V490_07481 [Pseudogymnoascus sp. VKM F-3557]|nr:hypothetical protein V490_07481 [Pseudogymnoascus sp. VKM F-3557]
MSYSNGVVDPNFIILTSAPSHDRALRRRFIRHRVMINYHAQRASKKRTETSTSASKSKHAENKEDASQQDLAEAPSAAKSTRTPEKKGVDGSVGACALTTPTGRIGIAASSILRPVESANLLQPRIWADARDRWSSETVMRFLCGQVGRAVRNAGLGGVVFVHGSVGREMMGMEKRNCLREWQELVKKYSTVDGNVDMESAELWEKVFEAQERIYTSCASFSKWQLLSAAQAMTLFVLLRLRYKGNHPRFPDADIALLFSLGKTFKHLQEKYINRDDLHRCTYSQPTTNHPTTNFVNDGGSGAEWDDWVFRESTIRTSTVYFLLTLVASMDFGLPCDRLEDWRLEDMPLPAGREAWEARGREGGGGKVASGVADGIVPVLTFGDLVRMRSSESDDEMGREMSGRIKEWQEGVDELGLIVSVASGLKV